MTTYIELPQEGGGGGGGSAYWQDAAANFAGLPAGTTVGELRQTLDTGNIYRWNGASWDLAFTYGADVTGAASSVDSEIVLFNGTTGKSLKRATGTGVVKATSGVYGTGTVSLTSEVSGVLPVASGGTNSSAALSNNRVVVSSTGAIVENAAITINRALISDGSGLPTHSVTTATELGFVNGVTSSIQTQLNTKVTAGASTDNAVARFDGTGGNIQNSGVILDDLDNLTVPGSLTVSGTDAYILFPSLTTAERNALTASQGMVIYNSTVHTMQAYVAGTVNDWVDMLGWGAAVG